PARCPPRTGSYPATATSPSTASSAGCSTPATAACSSSNWSARASRRRATGARWRAAATHSQGCSSADERRPSAGPPSQLIHLADGDELDLSPDALVAFELGEQVGLADLRVTACAGAEIAHGKAPLRVAVAAVQHGVRRDRRRPRVGVDDRPGGEPRLRGPLVGSGSTLRWHRRVHAVDVLGEVHADTAAHAER